MKKKSSYIEFTKEQRESIKNNLKEYIDENLDIEISSLQGELFLDFITEKIGPYYYNSGILNSINTMNEKVDDLYLLMKDEE